MRAVVDHDLCAGAAQCVQRTPNAFQLNDDGLSEFRPSGPFTDNDLQEAADRCPMAAITITD
ncbi:ferredoxin [Mycobacterium saskatchewanense]|uniref:ferredoxin n=1 Tax=Mycobacterium saskatchewanense TaxID=220927 RepID=UPI000A16BD8F|nr:ferredoxin [Mycobacterium saskatchewanense]